MKFETSDIGKVLLRVVAGLLLIGAGVSTLFFKNNYQPYSPIASGDGKNYLDSPEWIIKRNGLWAGGFCLWDLTSARATHTIGNSGAAIACQCPTI